MTSFKRWFGAGAIVLAALALIACPAMVPKPSGHIADMTFDFADIGDTREVKDLGRFFSEDDRATYSAVSDKEAVATASVADTTLTVTAKGAGEATVTVTATAANGRDTATQSFKVTVNPKPDPPPPPVNHAPSVRTIPDISLQEGATKDRTLSRYYTDPEGDSLSYTAESSADAVATVSDPDADSMITITAVAAGTATITVTASDGTNAAVEQTFEVEVTAAPEPPPPPPNLPPVVRTYIDDMTIQVDMSEMLTLSEYFLDPEFLPLTYSAASSDDTKATVTVDLATSVATITAVAAGSATITATATDTLGSGLAASQTFDVTVTETPPPPPDNRAPVLLTSNLITNVDAADFRVGATMMYTLSDHFQDPDNDMLMYEAATSDSSVASVTEPDADGMFTLTAEGVGNASITVKASDMYGASAQQTFTVGVGSNAPTLTNVSNVVALVLQDGMRTETLDLMAYFSDPEDDDLTFAIGDRGNASVATVTDPDADDMITITAVGAGETMIEVTAEDSDNDPVSLMLDVRVSAAPEAPNQAPVVVTPILDQSLELDFDVMKTVEAAFSDPDDDALTYTVASDDPSVTASISGTTVTIEAVAVGSAMVTVTATDGEDSTDDVFMVTVTAPAVPTWKKEIPDVTFEHDGGPQTFMLADYFDRATMYHADDGDGMVVEAAVNDAQTMLTLTRVGAGNAVVEITPSNSGGDGATQSITVMVAATPTTPTLKPGKMIPSTIRVVQLIDANAATADLAALDAAERHYDLTDLIRDPDGPDADLVFSTTTTDPKMVAVYSTAVDEETDGTLDERQAIPATTLDMMTTDASRITIRGRSAGEATVTITATADDGGTMSWPIVVMVGSANVAPAVGTATAIPDLIGAAGADNPRLKIGESRTILEGVTFTDYFTDVNVSTPSSGDTLTLSVKYYAATTTATDGVIADGATEVDAANAGVTYELTGKTWAGDPNAEFTLALRGVRGTDNTADAATDHGHVVALIATDSYGMSRARLFRVIVNNPPKAEGAQASATPPGTPLTLGDEDDYMDIGLDTVGTSDNVAFLLVDPNNNGGYFHDPDGDILTCRINASTGADVAKFTLEEGEGATGTANPRSLRIVPEKIGNASVTIACVDTFMEHSPEATLNIRVSHQDVSQQ